MAVTAQTRGWLEAQYEYYVSKIQSNDARQDSIKGKIRRDVIRLRKVRKNDVEFKGILQGIHELLTIQNWEV